MKVSRREAGPKSWEDPAEFFTRARPVLRDPPPGVLACNECQTEKANMWRMGSNGKRNLCNK